jgi:hypothetical protein
MRRSKEPIPVTPVEKALKKLNMLKWDGCDSDEILDKVRENYYCPGCKHERICKEVVNEG